MDRRPHYAGNQHVVPEPGSRGWVRIVERGCGLREYNTPDGPDSYCGHGYTWDCDECPWGVEAMDRAAAEWEWQHQGPPRPRHLLHPDKLHYPRVSGELDPSWPGPLTYTDTGADDE